MIQKKKKKRKASFGFSSHIQGRFRPFLACFGRIDCWPIRPDMADTARFWPNQSGLARIEADSAQIELCRREFEEKKNTQTRTDAWATALDAGAAPLVPRPCFLDNKKEIHFPIYSEFKIGKS